MARDLHEPTITEYTSGIHPGINGDKIGERLALADEAGIEPALTMYSRPAFAIVSNKGPTKDRRDIFSKDVVPTAFGPLPQF